MLTLCWEGLAVPWGGKLLEVVGVGGADRVEDGAEGFEFGFYEVFFGHEGEELGGVCGDGGGGGGEGGGGDGGGVDVFHGGGVV